MSDFDPDAFIAQNQNVPQGTPQAVSPVDQTQIGQFDPDDFIKTNVIAQASALQSKFGSNPQQIMAGIEGAARGGSLGTSDYIEQQLGISSADAIKQRAAANPATALVGNALGSAALVAGTAGFGGLAKGIQLATGLGEGLAGTALGSAVEGSILGGGNVISDAALGDPNLNAQKILSDVGMGAALGGGLGVLSKAIGAVPAMLRGEKGIPEIPVIDVPSGKKPTSLEEMQAAVDHAKKYGNLSDLNALPQKSEALDANSRIGQLQQFPLTDMQLSSLDSQDARNEFKTLLDVPGKNGEILRNYQGAQKKELLSMLDNTIDKEVSPGYDPTTNALEAGERASQAFTQQIQKVRSELGPAFEAIKSTPLNQTEHLPGLMDYLTNPETSQYANPKLAAMFDTSGDDVAFKPYSTSMGVDQATYRAVKQAIEAVQEKPDNFEQLFDIRKGLSQHVDITKLGDASKEISAAKASMMDYIQDTVQKESPDLAVRDTFKNWAINEQNAQLIERKFGAEIGSNNWRSQAKGGDEGIIKKIFRDSDSTAAAKAILPAQDFTNMLADHLSILRNEATDSGVFSSNKFNSALKRNQYALGEAFSDNAPTYQKIKDALTLTRLFADDKPINPSGTAKTLIQSLLNGGIDPFKHISNLVEYGKGKSEEIMQARQINAKLAGTADSAKKLNSVQGILKRIDVKLTNGAKAIFGPGGKGAAIGTGTYLTDKMFDKISKDFHGYYSNPETLMNDMADNSHGLFDAAPNITQGIHTAMAQAVSFLNSKLPQPIGQMPLSPDFTATKSQKTQFSKYYQAVNEPLSALDQVKNGSLSNETMEALQVVHPQLFNEMKQKVGEHMNLNKVKEFPYARKLSLSKFLGQPLDTNMVPGTIQSNQAAFNAPRLSQQSTPQQGRKSSLGGLKQLNFSSRVNTRQTEETK
jgi:hypothetical protein